MPEGAGRVNGITDEMLADKPALEAVFPDFLRLVDGTIIIAHNAPFDTGFVNEGLKVFHEAAQRAGARQGQGSLLPGLDEGAESAVPVWAPPFAVLPNRIADTLVMARRIFPGQGGHKLQELAAALGLNVLSAHRAEDDARICMEIFFRLAELAKGKAA
jgi:DNA polymerase-3 subunit epsilon